MGDELWICSTCTTMFIGQVPDSDRCPACCDQGPSLTPEGYYHIQDDGLNTWADRWSAAHGRFYV